MRRVARLRALGLRGRIIGVVVITAVAALGVAAATLLTRLESSLKDAERASLQTSLRPHGKTLSPFSAALAHAERSHWVAYALVYPTSQNFLAGKPALRGAEKVLDRLDHAASGLASRIGASEVAVFRPSSPVPVVSEPTGATQTQIAGTDYAVASLPLTVHLLGRKEHWTVLVRKPLNEVNAAVASVRTALLTAALVAAALTLLLAIPFAGTVVRRLRRLRQTALRVAHEGPNVEIPVDRARDEVGDLARTFALMQQQLRRQEEARRAFVATASHELRTPVASLDGLLELLDEDLQSGNPDLDDARALLERSRAQSRRLGRLAADLLDLSRIDAEIMLRSEPVELGELSRAVMAEFEMFSIQRGIATTLDDQGGSVWALGDPGSVARILRILLDNALRLSPEGTSITVQLRNGERAQLSVCDQGPGVRPDDRELIFERFMRGRDTGSRGGFGLGLAIGRELAERMGGELVLEDHGTPGARFTLRLPVAQAPQEEPVAVV